MVFAYPFDIYSPNRKNNNAVCRTNAAPTPANVTKGHAAHGEGFHVRNKGTTIQLMLPLRFAGRLARRIGDEYLVTECHYIVSTSGERIGPKLPDVFYPQSGHAVFVPVQPNPNLDF